MHGGLFQIPFFYRLSITVKKLPSAIFTGADPSSPTVHNPFRQLGLHFGSLD